MANLSFLKNVSKVPKLVFAKYKMQLIALAVVAILSGLAFTCHFSYKAGVNADAAHDLKVLKTYQEKVTKLSEELADAKAKSRRNEEKRVNNIRKVTDPSGCVDTGVPPDILQQIDGNGY